MRVVGMKTTYLRSAVAAATTGILMLTGCAAQPSSGAPKPSTASAAASRSDSQAKFDRAIGQLETADGARIGVSATVVGAHHAMAYRGTERFAFDSTGKLFTAGLLLREDSDAQLNAVVRYASADLVDYSPITSAHLATGMTLRDIIAAALQYSDNTAENLMFDQLGGPAAVQSKLREIGDSVSNVDRNEPDLNSAVPGDPRDTTTPAQMATDLQRLTLGNLLAPARRSWLLTTMQGNTTGGADIRAAVPHDWTVADKTGHGDHGTNNDIAVLTKPHGAPIVVTVYTSETAADATPPADVIAKAAQLAIDALT